jgi:hypothetical protein
MVARQRKRAMKASRDQAEGSQVENEGHQKGDLDLPLQKTANETANGPDEGHQQDDLEFLLEQAANGTANGLTANRPNQDLTVLLRQAKLSSVSRGNILSCPVCAKQCAGFNAISQHIGTPACVRIKDSSLIMCRQCATILCDGCALKKHQGNKICLSKGLMLKDLPDGGATFFANAAAQVAANTSRVVELRQAIRLQAIGKAIPLEI